MNYPTTATICPVMLASKIVPVDSAVLAKNVTVIREIPVPSVVVVLTPMDTTPVVSRAMMLARLPVTLLATAVVTMLVVVVGVVVLVVLEMGMVDRPNRMKLVEMVDRMVVVVEVVMAMHTANPIPLRSIGTAHLRADSHPRYIQQGMGWLELTWKETGLTDGNDFNGVLILLVRSVGGVMLVLWERIRFMADWSTHDQQV